MCTNCFHKINVRLVCIILILICANTSALSQTEKSSNEIEERQSKSIELSKNWNKESIENSIILFEKTASDWENIGEYEKTVFCLNEAVKLTQTTSDYETASKLLSKAINLSRNKGLNEQHVISLSLASLIFGQKGDSNLSNIYYKKALSLSETINSPLGKGYALFSAGMYNFYYGNFNDAKKFFEEANGFAKQTQDIQLLSDSLFYVGFSNARDGYPFDALEKMNRALKECEAANYRRGIALAYFGIGFVKLLIQDKQQSLDAFKKAENLFPSNFEWAEKAKILNSLGVLYKELGDIELAKISHEKAFLYYKNANIPIGQLATYPSLAEVEIAKGNYQKARTYYNDGLDLAKLLNNDFYTAVNTEGKANLELLEGDYNSAIKEFKKSLIIYDKIGIKLPRVENNLGLAFEKKGDYNLAKNFFNKALTVTTKTNDILAETENLYNLAKISLIEGNTQTSLEQISKSIKETEDLYTDVANSNLKRSYFSNVYERYELYINLLMQKHKQSPTENFAIQALQASEKSRSRSLLETLRLSEANFTKDANPELVQKEKELLTLLNLKASKLTDLLSSNAEKTEIEKIDDERRTLENELETVKADLKQQSPIYSAIKNPPPFDVAEFQQNNLDDKTVCLEFAFGEKESYLWLISKTEVSSYVLPSRDVLENRVDKIRQAFENRQMLEGEDADAYQKRIADLEHVSIEESKLLSSELLGQVVDKIADKRLIIVPDGKLALLPLSALPFPNSDENLIAKNEIVYEPSASLLNILPNIQTRKQLPTKDLLVFADPVFSDSDNRLTAKNETESFLPTILGLNLRDFRLTDANGKIPRLFATQAEADSIAETVGKSRTVILSGFAANRERVLNPTISDYRMLHFATHGLVDVNRPEVSSIVLSQFDENGGKLEGFLRLQDIYALDLASDLVVLSACQSGIGKEIKGEGLMSLNNAFLQAGAKSVVSSAWKVDDDATAEFMKRFYANLTNKRLTTSDALRQTQIEMVSSTQYKSPFYWAAFTVQGEFRQPISVSTNFFYAIIVALIAIIGIGLFWKFRRNALTHVRASA
jgi:CHAT domain-containing protein